MFVCGVDRKDLYPLSLCMLMNLFVLPVHNQCWVGVSGRAHPLTLAHWAADCTINSVRELLR